MSDFSKITQDFLRLACDDSYDNPQYPVSSHLQEYVMENVLTAHDADQRREAFLKFFSHIAGDFSHAAAQDPRQNFKAIMEVLPAHTQQQARVRHAASKLGLQLGLRAPHESL